MTPQQLKDLLDKYSRGECTPQEEQFINHLYHNINASREDEWVANVQQEITQRSSLEASIWSKIKPATQKRSNFLRYLKVAAALFIPVLVGTGIYLFSGEQSLQNQSVANDSHPTIDQSQFTQFTNSGLTVRNIKLEDGSTVSLKPKSELRVARSFAGNSREVHLTGEAFFKVKRDESRPFLVYSNEVVTRVLGTSFNIKAYQDEKEITVAVKTGKVSVYAQSGENQQGPVREVILTPNQKVVYNRDNEKVAKQLVEEPEIILAQPTLIKMAYDGAPVTRIFEVLEENYGVQIEYDEEVLSGCVLTTSMTDEGLYERIEVICKAINAEYSITSDAVIQIKSRGCM